MKTALLIGSPNSGKTTLFNLITGQNRKVANYSGITVDSAEGVFVKGDADYKIVDLPGVYGLNPTSLDEAVAVGTLFKQNMRYQDNAIFVVVDISRLELSLALVMSLIEIYGTNVSIIFNKNDTKATNDIDLESLAKELGCPFIILSGHESNRELLQDFMAKQLARNISLENKRSVIVAASSTKYNPFQIDFNNSNDFDVFNDNEVTEYIKKSVNKARDIVTKHNKSIDHSQSLSKKIDRFVLHPLLGGLIFLLVFYFVFHAIYTYAGPLMDLIDEGTTGFGDYVGGLMPEGLLKSLVVDGIIAGVGGVIIFLPQIMFLFFLLSLLEQSGYIARASIITDKVMSLFGLSGKAFLPFMSGFACSIPAIMSTRTLSDRRERLATLAVLPMITCSARLPVYILLVGTFVPAVTVAGVFNSQALAFFFLYFLGSFVALIMAKIFRLSFFKGESKSFLIELPDYQRPSLKVALKITFNKGKMFLKKAGTIILLLSMLIWTLSTFPRINTEEFVGKSEQQIAAIQLEHSALGRLGKFIEPAVRPLGHDWRMGVGLLVAFGARELFVPAMGTIFALGDVDEESESLRSRLRNEVNPSTGEKLFNSAVAWSLLIFFVFACQCIATLGIIKKETDSWKYVAGIFSYTFVLAWLGSFIAYRLLI